MGKWTELRHKADGLAGEQMERDIWSMAEHPGMPALVALINDVRFARLAAGTSAAAASDHGTLAHCMGAVDAIDELERRLQSFIEPPPREAETPPV